jgi:hypothetical protein
MGIGLLLFLAMTVAFLVFSSFGLLFYKLLPPAEPLLPLHASNSSLPSYTNGKNQESRTNIQQSRRPPQKYRSNFLSAGLGST